MTKQIAGTVTWVELGVGFWGIVGADNSHWRPLNLPDAKAKAGETVTLHVRLHPDVVTAEMWGTVVEIMEPE